MKIKITIGTLAIIAGFLGIIFVLRSENALVANPKGVIAHKELELIITNVGLMLAIIVPTYFFLFRTLWKVRSVKAQYDPDHSWGPFGELMLWLIPSVVVVVMAVITWNATHELDPYQPLGGDVKPMTIQVVAMDWKWLFIYPDEGIATLNFFQFPEQTPIHFELAADGSPMNSFWIPQLSGQIYSMTGMTTQLHVMAHGVGEYRGRAAEINGEGYADMSFGAKSSTQSDFEKWVEEVKKTSVKLDDQVYGELVKPAINKNIVHYSVEKDLFNRIVMKYMHQK